MKKTYSPPTRIETELYEPIRAMAKAEDRSIANMINVLLRAALQARRGEDGGRG